MASAVDIVNLALSQHLGQAGTVSSIDPPEGSQHAEVMAIFYPIARDTVLESRVGHNWSWAIKRVTLAEVTSTLDGWDYAYTLPSDFLKPISLLSSGETDDANGKKYIIEGQTLYANESAMTLRYVAKVTDTTKWSPLFVRAVTCELASMAAGNILRGQDARFYANLRQEALNLEAQAAASDAVRQNNRPDHRPSWIKAR